MSDADGPEGGSLLVNVTGMDADAEAQIALLTGEVNFTSDGQGGFGGVSGPYDLWLGVRPNGGPMTRFMIERDIEVDDGDGLETTLHVVDDTQQGVGRTIAMAGKDAGRDDGHRGVALHVERDAGGGQEQLDQLHGGPGGGAGAARRAPVSAVASDTLTERTARAMFHTPQGGQLTLPAFFEPDSIGHVDPVAGPVLARATFDSVAGATMYRVSWEQTLRAVHLTATGSWVGEASTLEWLQPDLSDEDGWDVAWHLDDGDTINWTATVIESDIEPLLELETAPQGTIMRPTADWDGARTTVSIRTGIIL